MPRCKCLRAIDKCAVDPKAADPRAGAKLAGQAFLMVAACALVGLSVKTYVEQMARATAEWPSATCAVVDANVTRSTTAIGTARSRRTAPTSAW